jgi:uncharacterized protein with PIN domain
MRRIRLASQHALHRPHGTRFYAAVTDAFTHAGVRLKTEMAMTNDTRFVADTMLGKLTKWLRVMGFDVKYDSETTDVQLLRCAEADERVLLTRDCHLISRRGSIQHLYIESDYYHQQVRQVVQAFNLAHNIQAFTRCIRCNALLDTIAKPVVVKRVPAYIYATHMLFKHCVLCNHLYWGGTHRDNMLRQLQVMLSDLLPVTSEILR